MRSKYTEKYIQKIINVHFRSYIKKFFESNNLNLRVNGEKSLNKEWVDLID